MSGRLRSAVAAGVLALLAACGGGGGGAAAPPAPPPPPPPPPPPASFSDVTAGSGISYTVGITPPSFDVFDDVINSTHGGAAAGDCDGDGDVDLFITYGDSERIDPGGGPNRLYLNQLDAGNGLLFVDTAEAAGVAYTRTEGNMVVPTRNDRHSGPMFADLDGDGHLDLFIGGLFRDPSKIYRNNGDCTFEDVTATSGIDGMTAEETLMATFGDYDLDGDLDLFMTHYGTPDSLYAMGFSEHLWENVSSESTIQFVNRSSESFVTDILWSTRGGELRGFPVDFDATLAPTFARINDDVWPDIAIAGDGSTSQLLLNNGDRTFRDGNPQGTLQEARFGMGSALGDFDDDGDLDWFITSIAGNGPTTQYGNRFYRNDPLNAGQDVLLRDRTDSLGDVWGGGWGWAACFLDIDNDTDLDIYHTNGFPRFFEGQSWQTDASIVFVNDGGTYIEDAASYGLDDRLSGRGVVCADFDEDGDIDLLLLTDRNPDSGLLWENRTAASGNNYLQVQLNGLAPNTEAIGARIYVTAVEGGPTQMREVMIANNYTSQNPTVQHFGLGSAAVVHEVRVEWPARITTGPDPVQPEDESEFGVAANQRLVIPQPAYP